MKFNNIEIRFIGNKNPISRERYLYDPIKNICYSYQEKAIWYISLPMFSINKSLILKNTYYCFRLLLLLSHNNVLDNLHLYNNFFLVISSQSIYKI